jgi:ubiquitin C-terminal hydrolase
LCCKKIVSNTEDYSVIHNLFYFDQLKTSPTNPESFSNVLLTHLSTTDDFFCYICNKKTETKRVYSLTKVPEIIFCLHNLYVEYGGQRKSRYFPDQFKIDSINGGKLVYKLVGQIEHSGSLSGGHYWARALRKGEMVYMFNDLSVSSSNFISTPNTYIIVYHYDKTTDN